MWDAIHKKTNKPYFAYQVWNAFEKPNDEEWICCPICKKPVTPVTKHKRNIYNKEIWVPSFFKMFKNVGGCISYESNEHKMGKIIVATMVENDEINFTVKGKKIERIKFKEVPELSYRWEQNVKPRRADVLFKFEKYNQLLGKGIVFEIAITEQIKSLEKKTVDWIKNGYSICWLFEKNFNENTLLVTEIEINYPYSLYRDIVKHCDCLIWNTKKAFYQGDRYGRY